MYLKNISYYIKEEVSEALDPDRKNVFTAAISAVMTFVLTLINSVSCIHIIQRWRQQFRVGGGEIRTLMLYAICCMHVYSISKRM